MMSCDDVLTYRTLNFDNNIMRNFGGFMTFTVLLKLNATDHVGFRSNWILRFGLIDPHYTCETSVESGPRFVPSCLLYEIYM